MQLMIILTYDARGVLVYHPVQHHQTEYAVLKVISAVSSDNLHYSSLHHFA
jgi:hypothetical protein